MFDTPITIVGNVLTPPEWRRTRNTHAMVVNFRIASTARRLNKQTGQWADGDSLRVRVVCWKRLAENCAAAIQLGDPVIVHGRLYTRDWTDDEGQRRTSYEVEATTVGHDLAKGTARFERRRVAGGTDVINDDGEPVMLGGEPTDPVDLTGLSDDLLTDEEFSSGYPGGTTGDRTANDDEDEPLPAPV
jgi:single-strand DNA-binding protein